MHLSPVPPPPEGVAYALTVPQSVLFADLSLRGSRRPAFQEVFGTEYEVDWVVIDDGAMSWDFTGDDAFAERLLGTTDPVAGARRFIAAMGATAREVEKISAIIGPAANRRSGDPSDLLTDLREYWRAYERHMTSLFTFWNVEQFLTDALIEALKGAGLEGEVASGLQRFLTPSETNYFALERRHLARLGLRFGAAADTDSPSAEAVAALDHHVTTFGFLLAPFNLGTPPSVASVKERLGESDSGRADGPMMDLRPDQLDDLDGSLRELGLLAQELTFWKTERLDVMSLGDARGADLYKDAAELLSIDSSHLFAMRRDEIEASIESGTPQVDEGIREQRLGGYCLLLSSGEIEFYEPTGQVEAAAKPGPADAAEGPIRGMGASRGRVTGPVRILLRDEDNHLVEQGEVLVTTMTRPEFGPALDRAVAFVTDQGGRMSHAAIISREMGKPCVIGTEVATQRLRDGMVVTVDGEEGVVIIEDEPSA